MQSKTYKYEEALSESVEYFGGNELAAKTFLTKYALRDNDQQLLEKTPDDMHIRIATELARIEKNKFKTPLSYEDIYGYIKNFNKLIPQGSPMFGIGNKLKYISLSNCYVVPTPHDSYGGIMLTDQQLVQISKRRGGVGVDISSLRPAGMSTQNAARTSTGVVSFMSRFSNSIREVGQNGRRGALMITLSIHHPESVILLEDGVEPQPIVLPADPERNLPEIHTTTEFYNPDRPDFATIKYESTKVTGANVSVRLTDEFLTAVAKGTKYEQRWPVDSAKPVISKMVDARRVWKKIIKSAWQMGEPGLLFWDTILRESPADCYAEQGFETTSTNPCSEIPLCPYDSCRLLAINLYAYVNNPFTKDASFDFDTFHKDTQVAQRLMDDLVDLEIESIDRILAKIKADPEPEETKLVEINLWTKVREACVKGRRTGTGITALGDAMAALDVKYGSDASIKLTDKIYKTLKLAAYRASVDMAKELGYFPIWNHNQEKANPFLLRIKDEDPELYAEMKKHGRRNIALLTTAPTGTVSIMTQTTSGVEPMLMIQTHVRNVKVNPGDTHVRVDFTDKSGDKWQKFEVNNPTVEKWKAVTGEKDITKSPWYGCCAEDLDWKQRVKMQAAANRHIDHAISATVNLPKDVSVESVGEIYEAAWETGSCKGITVYRKGSRVGVLVEKDSKKECLDCDDASAQLKLAIGQRPKRIIACSAPPRPPILNCDIHRSHVEKHEWLFLVGLMEGVPYEVFGGKAKGFVIPKKYNTGWIEKNGVKDGRTTYNLILGDLNNEDEKLVFENIAKSFEKYDKGPFTRAISLTLRHGIPVKFTAEQIVKDEESDLYAFNKALARVLKKYIDEGEASGMRCPQCSSEHVVYRNGCPSCSNCGFSTCA